VYCNGCDINFRPIIQIRVDLIVKKLYEIHVLTRASEFLLNYILKYGIVDGKVEKWILIVDMNKVGLTSMPVEVSSLTFRGS
jgi:hypothetical protein